MVPKPKQEQDECDRRNFQLNAKVVYTLLCSINRNEYNRICQYKSAKKIWRLLEITRKGTNQVKGSKITLLVHTYELFFMKDNETIVKMITRFIDIVIRPRATAPFDSFPATAPFDSCPLGVSTDSCPTSAP